MTEVAPSWLGMALGRLGWLGGHEVIQRLPQGSGAGDGTTLASGVQPRELSGGQLNADRR